MAAKIYGDKTLKSKAKKKVANSAPKKDSGKPALKTRVSKKVKTKKNIMIINASH